jgi:ferredoxin
MKRIVRVTVDAETCLSHRFCVDLCPEVFYFTEDSWTACVRLIDYGPVDAKVREAVACCPVDAIRIEETDGP